MKYFSSEEFDKLSEMDQIKNEEDFVHSAFLNSFLLLTGRKDEEEFFGKNGPGLVVAHDISEPISKDELDGIITYFAELDDFDKCIELRDKNFNKKTK